MVTVMTDLSELRTELQAVFGENLRWNEPLARYTSARIGGPADALLVVRSKDELAQAVKRLWEWETPFFILGGGSNVLVSDAGVRGVVVLNRARQVEFRPAEQHPSVWAESGANLGAIARQAAVKGLSGLEWAVGIPGTVGGAVVGNAGAHGGDIAGSLLMAEILHRNQGYQEWSAEHLDFDYRSSRLKRNPGVAVVLAAAFRLQPRSLEEIQNRMDAFTEYRRKTQPTGASMGSMFKNPPGDSAGRLIDAAGLKGTRVGGAEISPVHVNFFINHGDATAQDVWELVQIARARVAERFGVTLELEIQLIGQWNSEVMA